MRHIIEESILGYQATDFEDWCKGKKDKWLTGIPPEHVLAQPNHHFGEYFVLAHYEQQGWHGHRFYALGDWEPENEKLAVGRAALARCIDASRLAAFRRARILCGRADGKGEPDLFLYSDTGACLFVEVKKDNDKMWPEQLQCLAQIRALLQAEVGVARLTLAGVNARSRKYELDLVSHVGRHIEC